MDHKSEDKTTAPIQDILRVVRDLKEVTAASYLLGGDHSFITTNSPIDLDSINLPSPRPLLPSLLEAGVSHEISAAISKIYHLHAEQLRRRIQDSVVTTCRGLAELPVVAFASSPDLLTRKVVFNFTEFYLRRIEQWKQEIIQRIKHTPETLTKTTTRISPTFNHVGASIVQSQIPLTCLTGLYSVVGTLF